MELRSLFIGQINSETRDEGFDGHRDGQVLGFFWFKTRGLWGQGGDLHVLVRQLFEPLLTFIQLALKFLHVL